jgi:hypothetical protein
MPVRRSQRSSFGPERRENTPTMRLFHNHRHKEFSNYYTQRPHLISHIRRATKYSYKTACSNAKTGVLKGWRERGREDPQGYETSMLPHLLDNSGTDYSLARRRPLPPERFLVVVYWKMTPLQSHSAAGRIRSPRTRRTYGFCVQPCCRCFLYATCFGLHGHLQVCRMFYFRIPEWVCFAG